MRTTITKSRPGVGFHFINEDGMVWDVVFSPKEQTQNKKYTAVIPDERIDHLSFEVMAIIACGQTQSRSFVKTSQRLRCRNTQTNTL